jgi:hypothetical protein
MIKKKKKIHYGIFVKNYTGNSGFTVLRVPEFIVFLVRFLCIAGHCLVSSLWFSAFVSIELYIVGTAAQSKSP